MTQRHKHYDVIVAWAEGKPIQVKQEEGYWEDWIAWWAPPWQKSTEYRIKPEVMKYRVGLKKLRRHGQSLFVFAEAVLEEAERVEKSKYFVRWLTEWVEVEV